MIPLDWNVSVQNHKPLYFVEGAEINHNIYVLSTNIFYKNITSRKELKILYFSLFDRGVNEKNIKCTV